MGSWGHEAFENDDAADLLATLINPVMKPVRSLLKTKPNSYAAVRLYDKARAAYMLMVSFSEETHMIAVDVLSECEQANLRIWRDKQWVESFRDPTKAKQALTRELRRIQEQEGEAQRG